MSEELIDALTCPICFLRYNTCDQQPVSADCGHTICRKCVPICCDRVIYKCSSCRTEYPLRDSTPEYFGKVNYALLNIVEMAEKGLFDAGEQRQAATTAKGANRGGNAPRGDLYADDTPPRASISSVAASGSYCPLFVAGTCTRGYSCSMLHILPVETSQQSINNQPSSTQAAAVVARPPTTLDGTLFTGAGSHITGRSTAGTKQSTLSGYNWDDVIPDDSFLTALSMRASTSVGKPPGAASSNVSTSGSHVDARSWTCSCCTLINEPDSKYCGVCSTPRDL